MNRLSGKKATLTGGVKGIGFSTAKSLLSEGCDITIIEKATIKKRNTVKIPVTLHLPVLLRGILPDSILFSLATFLFGVGNVMKNWTGYGNKS